VRRVRFIDGSGSLVCDIKSYMTILKEGDQGALLSIERVITTSERGVYRKWASTVPPECAPEGTRRGHHGVILTITVLNLRVMSGHFFFESYSMDSEKSKHCSDGVVR
jgi:hypothetical protein